MQFFKYLKEDSTYLFWIPFLLGCLAFIGQEFPDFFPIVYLLHFF